MTTLTAISATIQTISPLPSTPEGNPRYRLTLAGRGAVDTASNIPDVALVGSPGVRPGDRVTVELTDAGYVAAIAPDRLDAAVGQGRR